MVGQGLEFRNRALQRAGKKESVPSSIGRCKESHSWPETEKELVDENGSVATETEASFLCRSSYPGNKAIEEQGR